ncbi:TadE/TadG family type IV pilus assembly protein [Asticcacaulis taihuensis]|uniref:TadE/TadG family type IV pilus assembly protein n=1 Tax=Asticcacaulis taihuensis TaxID=260084 RepID=UPI0026F01C19|nr:TadE/TadG family type IV pilus assembly protein [Asticcacaulis taihuensis]
MGIAKLFWEARHGNVAVIAGLCALPLLGAVFGVIELGAIAAEKADLQAAVDAGALSGAGRLAMVTNDGGQGATSTAISTADQAVKNAGIRSAIRYDAAMGGRNQSVTLTAYADHKALVDFMGFGNATISVTATAENLGAVPLCVLQTGKGGTVLKDQARIRAVGCAVHSNDNILVSSGGMIQADATQAVGTVTGPVSPAGRSGAMKIDDPFADMNLRAPTDCVGKPKKIKQQKGTTETLPAGVHCEEFDIDKDATLILAPGEHYFMDDLKAKANAVIQGDDVTLIFGSTKKIDFAENAVVKLGARRSGPFSGFLIVTTRDNTEKFTIASDHVSKLLGTIYIPNAELDVETAGSVGQDSAWSIIVASSIQLKQNPNLVINTGYVGSGVPVPDGVGPNRNAPRLSK